MSETESETLLENEEERKGKGAAKIFELEWRYSHLRIN